jgi:hypothetical protein
MRADARGTPADRARAAAGWGRAHRLSPQRCDRCRHSHWPDGRRLAAIRCARLAVLLADHMTPDEAARRPAHLRQVTTQVSAVCDQFQPSPPPESHQDRIRRLRRLSVDPRATPQEQDDAAHELRALLAQQETQP